MSDTKKKMAAWFKLAYEEHKAALRRHEWWFREVLVVRWQPRLWSIGVAVEVEPGLGEYALCLCLGPLSLGFEVTP